MTPSFQDIFKQIKVVKNAAECYVLTTLEVPGFTPDAIRPDERRADETDPCDKPKRTVSIANPRVFQPVVIGQPLIDTGNTTFDALYILAINEMADNAVCKIQDGNFNQGQAFRPDNFSFGSLFFQAGTSWTYVWTRDTAYSVDLGFAALTPQTALNSLMFKASLDRNGKNKQIVQDTGTGGSYPISSDRVVWALAAEKLLHYLSGEERETFKQEAFEIVKNTIAHDRQVLFDQVDGLYSGEQSFLDWREQTYPAWVANEVIHVGMSKCLSTNLLHLNILNFAASLAQEKDPELANQYQDWAKNLKAAISNRLYLPDSKLYSTFITTFLDGHPAHQYDLLGSVLAILLEVPTSEQSRDIIANYPVLPYGPPVIYPQQKDTPIYHNRAIWPFVTAYWVKAAKKVGNIAAVNHGIKSLIQAVIRYRSNRENLEMVSGTTYFADKDPAVSGPVVDSQAQLWSIAGYLSMVHDVIFGLETSNTGIGIRFLPYITSEIRNDVFGETHALTLKDFPYQGKTISVTVNLPAVNRQIQGVYAIAQIKLNDQVISQDSFISSEQLQNNNQIEIQLSDNPLSATPTDTIRLITDTEEWRNLFAPKYPIITSVDLVSGKLQVSFHANGENTQEIAFNLYRDGKLVQENLPGSKTVWIDPDTNPSSPSHCYTIESFYKDGLANFSQKSRPLCYWGSGNERITEIKVDRLNYYIDDELQTPVISRDHGDDHPYYANWGKPNHRLVLETFKPKVSGAYLLQVSAANGSGGIDTGITCAVKFLEIFDLDDDRVIKTGYLLMPQTGSWDTLKDSSFVQVNLVAGKPYKIVIREDEYAHNMSYFQHFKIYNGTGGSASYNNVNITSLKILALTA